MKRAIKNILIVDDEEDICYLVKNILKRKSSAQIDICTSVHDALEKLSEEEYDLAFFDMHLNDGSGAQLIEFIQSELHVSPYIVVISAYTSPNDMDNLNNLNINEFVPKPLSREKIINCFIAAAG